MNVAIYKAGKDSYTFYNYNINICDKNSVRYLDRDYTISKEYLGVSAKKYLTFLKRKDL